MTALLRSLPVLVLDCQASGATPVHGDLLELAWAVCDEQGVRGSIQQRWVVPRTTRRVSRAVRELTGWSEACIETAVPEHAAWLALQQSLDEHLGRAPSPTLIHYARFELGFLRDLHQRLHAEQPFPLDARCLHAVGARLFPDLPRRNIRALAGFLGHSTELLRRSEGHVAASAFIWRALLPPLEERGIATWEDLTHWLDTPEKAVRRSRRTYPLAQARRRALPDNPGVYRFVRSNGSVLYVGKAASLKKRIAGHFSARGPSTERGLELLSQVHDIEYTRTSSVLEAAWLESDEIKRLDPPYNVQLRSGERKAWFASRDLQRSVSTPDAEHPIGPLPSERALLGHAALRALASGAEATPASCALALAVPVARLPDPALFVRGYRLFADQHLQRPERTPERRVAAAALALWLERRRQETSAHADDAAPDDWDLARVQRRLERTLVQTGLLLRRTRLLRVLAEADISYREVDMQSARVLRIGRAALLEACDLPDVRSLSTLPQRSPAHDRRTCFDAAAYDRLRVLVVELERIHHEGGDIALRIGKHVLPAERLARIWRTH